MANSQLPMFTKGVSSDWAAEPGADFGEVFTRRWVVEFILDLAGYTADKDLGKLKVVEPACGTGAFLVPIVERLLESCRRQGRNINSISGAVRAFDLLTANAQIARKAVATALIDAGASPLDAERLAELWVGVDDFLLAEHELKTADFVVGNPPYIRLESVPSELSEAYRRACPTMRGRADIYVGFFELGLDLLREGGTLAYICADRWMHNQYGAALRSLVSGRFAVDAVIAVHDVPVFEDDVSAYPAITVFRNGTQGRAHLIQTNSTFRQQNTEPITRWINGGSNRRPRSTAFDASTVPGWFGGNKLWPTGRPNQLALLADLERRFMPLESSHTNTRVGIGVASGCDDVYITRSAAVEEDRLLPLLCANDLAEGTPNWSGAYLVNPWDHGRLVDLAEYPLLAAYYEQNQTRIRARHIAQRRPHHWYRTIDGIDPSLQRRPKLVLPDMKSAAHPVLDDGLYYPHHNLYYVVSQHWDLELLGGLLLSDVTNLFVGAYCVKMRGGTYRFQAQYLRQIRVPHPDAVTGRTGRELRRAFTERDTERATAVACSVFGIERSALK
jgi:adenine-specific DNA-methyltransferase